MAGSLLLLDGVRNVVGPSDSMPKKKSKRGDALKKRWEAAKEAGMTSLADTSYGAATEERDSDHEEAGMRTFAAFPLSLLRSSRARRLAALSVSSRIGRRARGERQPTCARPT